MKQSKPILHGRDHGVGGADPIPGLAALTATRGYYTSSPTVGAGTNGPCDFTYGGGDAILDLSDTFLPTFVADGCYAIHFIALPGAKVAGKSFNLSMDINNAAGVSGFFTSDFPMDGYSPSSSGPWGCVTGVWYAAAGDSIDAGIGNGDSSSHAFTAYFYIQKIL